MKRYGLPIVLSATLAFGALAGCAATSQASSTDSGSSAATASSIVASTASLEDDESSSSASSVEAASSSAAAASDSASASSTSTTATSELPDLSDQFSDRDLEQTADTSSAKSITVADGEDVSITEEGVYVLSGTAKNCTITVSADDAAKVQLVLDGLTITNETKPAVFVTSADKVFVTTTEGSTNTLTVSGELAAIGDEKVTGAIHSKDDITFNGKGTLVVSSTANGIVGKDDVKFTGGTYQITAGNHTIKGNDSVRIADGTFELTATKDGIHADNSDDQTLGYVYIKGGSFTMNADSDGIEGDAFVVVDGGTMNMKAAEGIEGTIVKINDGEINIEATDDGINATSKSTDYNVLLEINGGKLTINMGQGDTDALDANGDLIVNGGTIDITGQFAFDFDGQGQLNGGTVTVNGERVTEIANSMQMGGGMGGRGDMGGMGGQGQRPDRGDVSGQAPQGGFGGHGHGPRGDMSGQGSQSTQPDQSGSADSANSSSSASALGSEGSTQA